MHSSVPVNQQTGMFLQQVYCKLSFRAGSYFSSKRSSAIFKINIRRLGTFIAVRERRRTFSAVCNLSINAREEQQEEVKEGVSEVSVVRMMLEAKSQPQRRIDLITSTATGRILT